MTTEPPKATFTKQTWEESRKEVMAVNPILCKIIDNISPSGEFTLIRATYSFGSSIIDRGKLSTCYCKNASEAKSIESELGYATIPLGLLLNNACEAFVTIGDRIIPQNLMTKGCFFGNFELMNALSRIEAEPPWCVTAGLRSMFFLQKVSNKVGHQKLRKAFNLSEEAPQAFSEQWHTFVNIANSNKTPQWECSVLFFTKNWFNPKLTEDLAWHQFREFLFLKTWQQRHRLIEQPATYSLWQIFSSAIQNRKLKPKPYILDTIKHLLLIAQSISPAFQPIDNEDYAPIKIIKDAYYDFYKLNFIDYHPTIMGIGFLDGNADYLYYSLNNPTLYEGYYEKGRENFIEELREIKLLFDTLQKYTDFSSISPEKKCIRVIDNLEFDYFHRSQENTGEFLDIDHLVKEDKGFIEINTEYSNNFCLNSPFFSGCIRISKKRKNRDNNAI